jgi:hypothetical protein
MVNTEKITQLLDKHFNTTGDIMIDPDSGVVNVSGDVRVKSHVTQLPITFGRVGGHFLFYDNKPTHLQGVPTHLGKSFYVAYGPYLPLLRLIQYKPVHLKGAPDPVQQILNKYAGKGKALMLNLALDLKQAGYGGNARW